MSHNALTRSTLRFFGKTYKPDAAVPFSFFARMAARRALWLARGLLKTGRKCFVGPRVTIEGSGNLHLGRWITFENDVRINAVAREAMVLGDHIKIGAFSRVLCTAHLSSVGRRFVMGNRSACGEYCFFGAAGGISIGDNVMMGQYVSFHAQDHVFIDPDRPIHDQGVTEKGIEVANDCWIGAKATLLDGTKLGAHSVVAAGAVVKGEFPPYSLLAGVPARVIRDLREKHDG